MRVPTFAVFGSTGALCSWSTSTGAFTCSDLTGDVNTSASKATTLVSLNINATVADYIAGGGTAQAQTTAFSPALTALTTGAHGRFLPTAANTAAAPTLAVNGLTAKTITKCGTVALVAGDLTTTQQAYVDYDGTEWVLLNPQAVGCASLPIYTKSFFNLYTGSNSTGAITINTTKMWSISAPATVTSTKVQYYIQTADNTGNLYDLGLYDAGGTLICHTGATAGTSIAAATGIRGLAWTCTNTIFAGARYYTAFTGNATTAILGGASNAALPLCGITPSSGSATSGGVLNSSVTPAADGVVGCSVPQITVY